MGSRWCNLLKMAKLWMGSRWCKISDGQQVVKSRIEQFFSQGRNCPKKLAIRKKSTISQILTWNFGNKMAMQRESKSKNLKKIQVLEPPQIDVRTEPKLVGTNGMSMISHCTMLQGGDRNQFLKNVILACGGPLGLKMLYYSPKSSMGVVLVH